MAAASLMPESREMMGRSRFIRADRAGMMQKITAATATKTSVAARTAATATKISVADRTAATAMTVQTAAAGMTRATATIGTIRGIIAITGWSVLTEWREMTVTARMVAGATSAMTAMARMAATALTTIITTIIMAEITGARITAVAEISSLHQRWRLPVRRTSR